MKRMKKVLSIVLSLAMILTSITVYNTKTAKADGADASSIENFTYTINTDSTITAKWTHCDNTVYKEYVYIYSKDTAEEINAETTFGTQSEFDAVSTEVGGWCWNRQDKGVENEANKIYKNKGENVKTKDGGKWVIVVVRKNRESGNTVAFYKSEAIETAKYVNTDLNLKVERYEKNVAYLKWSPIDEAAKYEVYNADTNELLATKKATDDWVDIKIEYGTKYNFLVKAFDANGDKIEITNNETTAYQANTNMSLAVSHNGNVAKLTWTEITNVSKYKVYDGDDEIAELDANVKEYVMSDLVENVEHNITIKAFDEAGNEITITNNTKTVVYSTTSKAPTEHTKADFSNSLWTTLSTKAGTVDNTYSINSDNTLSTGVWYGIYAPHSKAAYHVERTACILSDDAASFTFQQRNVTSAWINGNEYANPSNALNCQGDCTEISTEYLNAE